MIASPLQAIDRLDHLTSLFEHARRHARNDAVGLSAMLDQAQSLLSDIAPAVAAARGTAYEAAVLQAALRAKESHTALTGEMGFEVAKLAGELRRLTAGAQATGRYLPESRRLLQGPLDQIG